MPKARLLALTTQAASTVAVTLKEAVAVPACTPVGSSATARPSRQAARRRSGTKKKKDLT